MKRKYVFISLFWIGIVSPLIILYCLFSFQKEEDLPSVAMLDAPPEMLASLVLSDNGDTIGRYFKINRTSTNYNAYHTYSSVKDNNFWYAYTQASTSSESAIIGYGTPSFRACFYSNSINIYYNDSYTVMSSPTLSRFSSLSSNWGTSTYVSNSTIVRFWNGSSGWSGSPNFCIF